MFDHHVAEWEDKEEAETRVVAEEVELEEKAEEEEVKDPMETGTQPSTRQPSIRTHNYNQVEDIGLCYAWKNISTGAMVGSNQRTVWGINAEYYNNSMDVTPRCTQGSLVHR